MKSGMDAVIGKPIVLQELFSVMEKMVPAGVGTLNEDISAVFHEKPVLDLLPLANVVDIDKGLAVWQDSLVFAESLISFADKHSSDAHKIQQLLSDKNSNEASMMSHALKGVAGNLSLTEVARLATEINASLKADNHELAENLLPSLQEALNNAAEAIEQLRMPVLKKAGAATKEFDLNVVRRLLQELLDMLDQDNPAVAEPVFNKLCKYLPQKEVAGIRKAIDAFDFNQAKSQTKILAEKLVIQLEG